MHGRKSKCSLPCLRINTSFGISKPSLTSSFYTHLQDLYLSTFPSFSNSSSKGSPSYQGCRQLGIGWSSPKRGPFPMNRFILRNFQQQVYCKLYLTPSGTFEKSISSLVFSVTGNMSQINPTASAVLSRTFPWMAKSNYILTKEPKKANEKSSQYGSPRSDFPTSGWLLHGWLGLWQGAPARVVPAPG